VQIHKSAPLQSKIAVKKTISKTNY